MEQEFVMLIMNCEKYRFKAEQQTRTWLKDIKVTILYFHVIGNPKLNSEYKFDFLNNILYVSANDDYNSLPKKVIISYKAIFENFNFKYIFKTDDDQNLININFLLNVQKILKSTYSDENKRIHYGGHLIVVDKPYLSEYHKIHSELPENMPILQTQYCSGRFYFLSNFAIKYLINMEKNICNEYLEDYAIGLNLHSFFKKNTLRLKTDKYFIDFY